MKQSKEYFWLQLLSQKAKLSLNVTGINNQSVTDEE